MVPSRAGKVFCNNAFSGCRIGGESVPGGVTGGPAGTGIKPSLFFCLFSNALQMMR
jgi:hypothetical protein